MKILTAEEKLEEVMTVFEILSISITVGPVNQTRLREHKAQLAEVREELVGLRRQIKTQADRLLRCKLSNELLAE